MAVIFYLSGLWLGLMRITGHVARFYDCAASQFQLVPSRVSPPNDSSILGLRKLALLTKWLQDVLVQIVTGQSPCCTERKNKSNNLGMEYFADKLVAGTNPAAYSVRILRRQKVKRLI
uniref:Uncharacterized protein n=1 Tax=Photinus pyralis TaxID=7054 RepID=A0A1Y1L2C2_PHOPY